ncbi:hypothetical protein [Marinimicrobium alkaliphilum]|uniref:hypothetical protein n=1 Tax=Marinimicrobium alkaliphilum TaxID=2202654 RepID=UPI00130036ED|nr:hypothetical protein [Marinimicrobium alkaliphilum]
MTHRIPALPLILILAASVLFSACGGGDSGDDSPTPDQDNGPDPGNGTGDESPIEVEDVARQIHSLGVSGAQGFVITGGGDLNAEPPTRHLEGHTESMNTLPEVNSDLTPLNEHNELEADTLYKVTEDGRLERVPFNTESGEELERGSVQARNIVEIGPDFVYLALLIRVERLHDANDPDSARWFEEEEVGVLVNKDTGLAYLAEEAFGPAHNMPWDDEQARHLNNSLRFDPQGNIFYAPSPWAQNNQPLIINVSNLGSGDLTAQALFSTHTVADFELSGDGSLMVFSGYSNQNNNQVYLAYDVDNDELMTLQSLTDVGADNPPRAILRDLDGQIYVVYSIYTQGVGQSFPYFRITRSESGQVEAQEVGELTAVFGSGTVNNNNILTYSYGFSGRGFGIHGTNIHNPNGRQVISGRLVYTDLRGMVYDVDLANGVVTEHDQITSLFSDFNDMVPTERHLWVEGTSKAGEPLVVRLNPARPDDWVELTFDANFELANFEPTGDRILFEGVRLSDQATVIGEMTVEGEQLNITVYEATEAPILTLRAITPADFVRVDGYPGDWQTDWRVLSSAAGTGPEGSDLMHYSELSGRGEYLGLIEFNGAIDNEHLTRVRFDTHEIIISPSGIGVRTSADNFGTDLTIAENARFALGQVLEFALDSSLLGESQPELQYVSRFAQEPFGAVELIEEIDGNDAALELAVTLGSRLGEEVIKIPLSESETLEIRWDEVALINQDGENARPDDTVSFPADDAPGALIAIEIEEAAFNDPEALYENFTATDPEGVFVEETLDTLN